MPASWTSPSGSRWEPAPGSGVEGPDVEGPYASHPTVAPTTGAEAASPAASRRRRGPVLVALVALLSVGGLGAGAYAYERSVGDGTPAAAATREAGPADGQGRPDGRPDGDHRRGAHDDASGGGQQPGSDGDR